ncbi:hypothetical protein ZOSMA_166G00460 [Zostera marina]|uniref:Cytochrome P450 n=1 Tax=Zostera marina TaxID=29655 RepID=A0A0K9PTH6_ZOSMR|nr:hypothetical protein ZOSMA_166G00460 [Zostera marina]
MEEISQMIPFFSNLVIFFLCTILLILLMRWWASRPWLCTCKICTAYLTSSWSEDFDNIVDWYTHLLRESPTRTIHIHVLRNTITANSDNVEHMLKTKFDNYPKGKPFSSILGDLLGRGIFNADGHSWSFQRKMASLELGSLSVRSYAYQIVSHEVRHRLLPLLDSVSGDGKLLDLQDVFRRFSFDTICKISFGLDPGCLELTLPISEFAKAFDMASRLSAKRATSVSPWVWKLKRILNIGSEKELKRAIGMVNELAREVIKQRRKLGFSGNQDLLSRFMGSIDDDAYLSDIVVSFLLAGRDTVSSGITSFFFLLSKYPEVEAAIIAEIRANMVGEDSHRGEDLEREAVPAVLTYNHLRQLQYVHAALYECMRLHPPVQFDSKFALEDDVLPDGTFVKKGTRVTYHQYAMGRMEHTWGETSNEFDPKRWLDDNGKFAPANPYKFPVFQGGQRVCLGKEMALMEMKSVVVSIVKQFKIDVFANSDYHQSPKFISGLTASLHGGLPAKIRKRN